MARAAGMLEYVVRAIDPVKPPSCPLHIAYQVSAGHVCMLHTKERMLYATLNWITSAPMRSLSR